MRLSKRVLAINDSPTLALGARVKELVKSGRDIIALNAGEPDFDTPRRIKKAAVGALKAGQTKYTPVGGTPELKKAIAEKFERENGLRYAPEEIVAGAGAKQCLFNAFLALLEEGDDILIPSPYWASYADMAALAGARVVPVKCAEGDGFALSAEEVGKAVTPKTKLILLNTPNNPTGAVYDEEELEGVARIARERDIFIIADEIYEHLVYGRARHVSVAGFDGMKERTLVVNGVSKTYSMTGWRLGYAAGPKELIKAMVRLQSQSTSNPSSISQAAAVEALGGPRSELDRMRREFNRRRKLLLGLLGKIPGVRCAEPRGAFYAFPNISAFLGAEWKGGPLGDAGRFSEFLLEEAGVAVVPGNDFGSNSHVRISYAAGEESIARGMERVRVAVEKLAGGGGNV